MTARKAVLFSHDQLLRNRGWTDELVAARMAEPDVVQHFPREPGRALEKLYLKGRVETLERLPEIAALILPRLSEGKARRSAAMREAVDTAEIVVEQIPLHELKIRALEAVYTENARQGRNAPGTLAQEWLSNIAFKFAVRRLVDYDRISSALPIPLDKVVIYHLCRDRINSAVLIAYPDLALAEHAT